MSLSWFCLLKKREAAGKGSGALRSNAGFRGSWPPCQECATLSATDFSPQQETLWNVNFNQELDFSYNVNNYFVIKEKIREGDSRWTHLTGSREEGTVFQVVEKLLKDNLCVKI